MKKNPFSEQRERILADAICPVVSELRLIDAADLIALLRFERHGSLADLVSSAAELYFHPGTIRFGIGGDYRLDWDQGAVSCRELHRKLLLDNRVSDLVDNDVGKAQAAAGDLHEDLPKVRVAKNHEAHK